MGRKKRAQNEGRKMDSSCRRPNSPCSTADPAAAVIGSNEDLRTEILLFLPTKSLIRFQSVDKQWKSLISSPRFSHRHLQRHLDKPQYPFILRRFRYTRRESFYFNPAGRVFLPCGLEFDYLSTKMLQSIHGLLLLRTPSQPFRYYVYNPTTKQSRAFFGGDGDDRRTDGVTLVFDPSRSPHYKVVSVRILERKVCGDQHKYEVDVYDSESHSWNVLLKPFIDCIGIRFVSGIYFKNKIYYRLLRTHYLDLEKGSFERILYPNIEDLPFRCTTMVQWNGRVCFADQPGARNLQVYELLGDDHPHPVVKYLADLEMLRVLEVFGIMIGEHEDNTAVVFHLPWKIVSYKFPDGSFETLIGSDTHEIFQEQKFTFESSNCYHFLESLTPV